MLKEKEKYLFGETITESDIRERAIHYNYTSFERDDEKGFSIMNNKDSRYTAVMSFEVPSWAKSFVIYYSGDYDKDGVGVLEIFNDKDEFLLQFTDKWSLNSMGQSLVINSNKILDKKTINVLNRKDKVKLMGSKTITFKFTGAMGYNLNKRYIKSLEFK